MRAPRTLVVGAVAASMLAGTLATASAAPSTSSAPSAAAASAATKPSENAKLNKTAMPKLKWFRCYATSECATVDLPLDYDNPKGPKTKVAVLRTRATGKRVGTLFVNPGGPGGSSTDLAQAASRWASPTIRKSFDVVGSTRAASARATTCAACSPGSSSRPSLRSRTSSPSATRSSSATWAR
ncbi:hypothetical protein [Janibacter melonis]|uniref:hypothetical protein n=1 Tax=Janibacter melonis TaxID=262209 RepID=UPI0020964850|nr:hypothetical protein [Janibacter melonis]